MHPRLDPARRCQRLIEWPVPCQQAWQQATERWSLIDGVGLGSHWAEETRMKHESGFGRYLGFLEQRSLLRTDLYPGELVTDTLIEEFVGHLRKEIKPISIWSLMASVHAAVSVMAPDVDWTWLRTIVNRLRHLSRPTSIADVEVVSTVKLVAIGIDLMKEAEKRHPRLRLDRSSWYRDGLVMALLAYRPVRSKNLCGIEIGRHLVAVSEGYWLYFPAEEVKNRRALEFPLPGELAPYLERYLSHHRPLLLQGNESNAMWISNLGRPMPVGSIADRLRETTRRYVGVPLSPHKFRHCAATSIAVLDPEHALIIREILGHATIDTANRYYNRAKVLDASRRHQSVIGDLRRVNCDLAYDDISTGR